MNSNQHIVDFSLDTKWNDLPEAVQHQSKRALLNNLAYGLACAVFKGKVGPLEVMPPVIYNPQILAFMAKIEPVEDQEIQKTFPAKRQARVEITTTDGRVFDSGVVDAPWGVSDNRPTDQDLILLK